MKTLIKILLLTSVFLLVLFSCKKDQLEIKKTADPCECASEVSADFVIEEQLYNVPHYDWVETDTAFNETELQFRALEENAEYKWYIGIEEFETKTASRYFSNQWIGNNIPITLVVKKEPNKTCFPNDDGYDSITKTFFVSQYPIENGVNQDIEFGSIEGVYRIFSSELNDSIDIGVDINDKWSTKSVDFINFDGTGIVCDSFSRDLTAGSFREFHFNLSHTTTSICTGLSGIVRNKINGEAEMIINSSTLDPQDNSVVDYTYNYFGRKLN
ncbi:hypothetical protein [Brumimicrobium oceani]|uniref:Uncharacterized protein n=1 Tax=Brumimicrobium oceani TaxID=2100725 RepID=A0A2U2XCT9_9FLAO|nr:hypothetical protein [Brumimicrobium oceani]PWH85614.1 hypothetical protein DIT68_08225 [Brumimicrobium oceani]